MGDKKMKRNAKMLAVPIVLILILIWALQKTPSGGFGVSGEIGADYIDYVDGWYEHDASSLLDAHSCAVRCSYSITINSGEFQIAFYDKDYNLLYEKNITETGIYDEELWFDYTEDTCHVVYRYKEGSTGYLDIYVEQYAYNWKYYIWN